MFSKDTIKNLPNNNRFYVLVLSVLASVFVACWLRVQVVDDQLYYIQLEQAFGFLAVGFLYVTLLMSPVEKIIGKPEWMKNVIFTRRATGVLVLYFAVLHASVSLWGQIGGWGGLALLPSRFMWALVISTAALIILCILAATSFDKVLVWMTFPRWKRLQRLVYLSGLLIIVHVWMIGAHFSTKGVQIVGFAALVVLFGLESWRMGDFLVERYHLSQGKKYFLFVTFWLIWITALGLIAFTRPAEAHMFSKDTMAGSGAVLHITPDDDPIAGEQSSLIFDIQAVLDADKYTATLTIIDEQQDREEVPAKIHKNMVSTEYIFPRQGLYKLELRLKDEGKQIYHFEQSQRVSRGVMSRASVNSAPAWAVAGMLGTGVALVSVAVTAFVRRSAISNYSKL